MHQMAGGDVDWKVIHEDFPILREQAHGYPLIYFDNAASSQKPRSVLDVLRHYYEHQNANVHRGLHELSSRATEAYDGADPVNLGSAHEISIADLVTKIAGFCEFTGKIVWDSSKPDGQPRRKLDTSRARERFGFVAKTDFDRGLKATVDWYVQARAKTTARAAAPSSSLAQ